MRNIIALSALMASMSVQAGIIGQWTFDDKTDSTGNWSDLTLNGATLDNGDLVVGTNSWARSTWSNSSDSSTISNQTLVAWVTLLDPNVRSGSALTIDSQSVDQFNGIVWSENWNNQWHNGSNHGVRQTLMSGSTPTPGVMQMLAITYTDTGFATNVNTYLDGALTGTRNGAARSSWVANDMEALFGARHTLGNWVLGNLSARIHEARIYDSALSQNEITQLKLATVSEPSVFALALFGLLGIGARRLKNDKRNV